MLKKYVQDLQDIHNKIQDELNKPPLAWPIGSNHTLQQDKTLLIYPISCVATSKICQDMTYKTIVAQPGSFTKGFFPYLTLSLSQSFCYKSHPQDEMDALTAAQILMLNPLSMLTVRAQVITETRSTLQIFKDMIKREKFRIFTKGLYCNLMGQTWLISGLCLSQMHSEPVLGLLGIIFAQPMFVISARTMYENQGKPFLESNGWQVTKEIIRKEGLRGFYRGLIPIAIIGSVNYAVFYSRLWKQFLNSWQF